MAIDTLNFPDAAPLLYQDGQVRHFSPEDGFGAEALQRPTRMLAARDNIIRDKLNEVVGVVNSREQYVNIPILSTVLPASGSEVVANFNIPAGFQARVINARVASSLTGQLGVVKVVYSSGTFGAQTGADILASATSAMTDAVMDTEFRASGELIVSLENQGTASARLSASVLVTLRPLGDIDGALVEATIGSGIQGPPGPSGAQGPSGPAGPTGTTSYGLRWRGAWVYPATGSSYFSGESYVSTGLTRDVVTYTNSGNTSSWVCVDASLANTNTAPSTGTGWAPLATSLAAITGPTGATGATGAAGAPGLNFVGAWVTGTAYAVHDVVVADDGSVRRTWHVDTAHTSSTSPTAGSHANLTEMFGSSTGPLYSAIAATFHATSGGGGYTAGTANGDYGAPALTGTPTVASGQEATIEAGPSGGKMVFLTFSLHLQFKGEAVIRLPANYGSPNARFNWKCDFAQISVSAHGNRTADTLTDSNTDTVGVVQPYPITVLRVASGSHPDGNTVKDSFKVTVGGNQAVNVGVQIVGVAMV